MKKEFLIISYLMLFLCFSYRVSAEEIPDDAAAFVSENLWNIFPFNALELRFEQKAPSVWGDIGTNAIYETNTADGTRNLLLYADPDFENYKIYIENPSISMLTDFSYEMDITLNDVYPKGESGCYIRYMTEKGSSTILYFSNEISFQIWDAGENGENLLNQNNILTKSPGRSVRLKIVRLTKGTLFYANDILIGSYQDGNSGKFQLMYGIETSPSGEAAECSLDNLVVRKVAR